MQELQPLLLPDTVSHCSSTTTSHKNISKLKSITQPKILGCHLLLCSSFLPTHAWITPTPQKEIIANSASFQIGPGVSMSYTVKSQEWGEPARLERPLWMVHTRLPLCRHSCVSRFVLYFCWINRHTEAAAASAYRAAWWHFCLLLPKAAHMPSVEGPPLFFRKPFLDFLYIYSFVSLSLVQYMLFF